MAGKAIRGITVEIGGDTTKLGKALEGVNSKSKDLQAELKGVNSLLKMDPGNVTLLHQKQDLLTQAIANTKEKLDTLKEAQEQVQAQFDKGEITEEQFRDFQREIVATEQKLEKLKDEFKEFGSAGAQQLALVGEKVKDVGGKVENFGKGMSVVTAGVGALFAGSIAAFKELDNGYDTIITKTGATGEALEELNAVADNIFGSMPTDMDTVGVAVGEVNTRFGYTGEQLETLSKQFIQFAEINGVDLNNSIGTVDKVLEQFNLTGEEASGVLDLITLKAQQTGIGADTLMESIQKNGATFKDMGIGVNEAIVLMAQFEANGVNVETALKGLQKATNEYAKDGLSMEESLSKTIDSIKNAKTDTEALALAQEVFGTKGANEMAKAIREGRINVDDLSASIEDYAGVVSGTYEGTLDPIDQGTVAMNNLKLAGSELGGALQTALAPILTQLVEKLRSLVSWFTNLSPGMQNTILIVLGVVAAIGPLILIIGKLITSVGTIMTFAPKLVSAFNAVKTAFSSLGAVFAANPIGIVIAAVAALVAAFILLWNNCEGFRNFWIGLWENLKVAAKAVADWFVQAWTDVGNFFIGLWDSIVTGVNTAIEAVKLVFSTIANWVNTSVIQPITGFFTNLWNGFRNGAASAWEGVKSVFSAVGGFFSGVFGIVKDKIVSVFQAGGKVFNNIKDGIVNVFKTVVNGIITGINKVVRLPFDGLNKILDRIHGIKIAGIKPFSWLTWRAPIPEIPYLARGGVLKKGQVGLLEGSGAEAVVPLEHNTEWLDKIAQRLDRNTPSVNNVELLSKLDRIYDRLNRLQVVLNSGALVGEILDDIDAGLADKQLLNARGV